MSGKWERGMTVGRCLLAHRHLLSETDRTMYDLIYRGLKGREPGIDLGRKVSEPELRKIFRLVRMDAPGLFWVGNEYIIEFNSDSSILRPKYVYDQAEVTRIKGKLHHFMDSLVQDLDDCDDEVEVEYRIHDILASRTTYSDTGTPDDHNIVGPLISGRGVCEGVAASFNFILNSLGIDCMTESGTTRDGELHSWNIVRLRGTCYHVDVTGDLSGTHAFLNVDDSLMRRDRDWDVGFECPSMELNYHVVKGTRFAGERDLLRHLRKRIADGGTDLEFMIDSNPGMERMNRLVAGCIPKNVRRYSIDTKTVGLGCYRMCIRYT